MGLIVPDQHANPIIFSLENGYVWVSGENGSWSIKIGQRRQALDAMRDFIDQDRTASDLLTATIKRATLS
jgi:hypothetical protein